MKSRNHARRPHDTRHHAAVLRGKAWSPEDRARVRSCAWLFALLAWMSLLYSAYRVVACSRLGWQCNEKKIQQHYDHVVIMLLCAGLLYATGPTLSDELGKIEMCFSAGAMFVFGGLGQLEFMQANFADSDAWKPPAAYIYFPALSLILFIMFWGFYSVRDSPADVIISAAVVVATAVFYACPLVVAWIMHVPYQQMTIHPHHYMIAMQLALMLRGEDALTAVARAAVRGIFIQGVAAYGPMSLLQD